MALGDISQQDGSLGRSANITSVDESDIYVASQWQLMRWRFRKHKLAVISLVVLIAMYLTAVFANFLAPYDPNYYLGKYTYRPPARIYWRDENGFGLRPYVYDTTQEISAFLERTHVEDTSTKYYIKWFVRGDPYKFIFWQSDLHLFSLDEPTGNIRLFLFGADRLGRDIFSRVIHGARISLSIGLIGVFLNMILGVLLGGISGYFGGTIDVIVQRVIELIRSIPTIPLWMALAAALPPTWPPLRIYFGITLILSFIGWTGLARVVRGRFLALREEDFVMAARLSGSSEMRVIVRHMVPSFLSYLIASLTLAVPGMILGETSLSFLGVGLRPPVVSWGVLLQEVQSLHTVALAPWQLVPGAFVVLTALVFNFVGDGLRDAADPYSR